MPVNLYTTTLCSLELKTRASIEEGELLETEPDVSTPLVLNCLAEGSPAPAITWTWNNKSIDKLSTIWTISEQVQGRQTQSVIIVHIKN